MGGERPGEGGGLRREGGVDRGAEHHHRPAAGDEAPVGQLVDPSQRALRKADPLHREVGVAPGRPEAGEVLRGRRDAALLHRPWRRESPWPYPPALEPKPRCVAAVSLPGRATSSTGARLTLAPRLRRLRAVSRPCRRLKLGPARPHHRRRGGRGAADPLHQAALLVDHHQQRVSHPLWAGDVLEPGDQPAAGRAAREVVGEEDHPGDPPAADHPLDRGRDPGAGEADDDPLARQLRGGSASAALRCWRLGAIGGERDPESEGGGRDGAEQDEGQPAPGGDQLHGADITSAAGQARRGVRGDS